MTTPRLIAATARDPIPSDIRIAPVATDRISFEAAVKPLFAPLLRRLVLIVGNEHDAEDVAQEAYIRAFRAWDRFDGTDIRAWLYTIALRIAFDQLRRRRRWLGLLVGRSSPASYVDKVDPDLWLAIARLEPRIRAALLYNVLDGYTQREIAGMLQVPEGTVASWLSRARKSLRGDLAITD